MEARAQLRWTQIPVGVVRTFLVAVLTALLVGGAGGYLVRGLSFSTTTTPSDTTTRPFVVEPAPYTSPMPSVAPEPTRDPHGNVFPI